MSTVSVPPEFSKILNDFVKDLYATFPEYIPFIEKWRKPASTFDYIQDTEERTCLVEQSKRTSDAYAFQFCVKKYPPRFFDFLYKNEDMFGENSEIDTEFLPHVYFKSLWQCDITDQTRETMWKYLQLILFTITGMAKPDFTNSQTELNQDDFKEKLEETLGQIQEYFQSKSEEHPDSLPMKEMDDNIAGLLGGKLGNLAKEIAEETAGDLNLDMENATDMNDVFQKLFKNPAKLMGLVKNVSDRLDVKLKDGEMNETDLMSEVGDLMSKMKHMPGMDNIHSMLGKMGMNAPVCKQGLCAVKPKQDMKTREKRREPKFTQSNKDVFTDEELEKIFNEEKKPIQKRKNKK